MEPENSTGSKNHIAIDCIGDSLERQRPEIDGDLMDERSLVWDYFGEILKGERPSL